MDPEGLFIGLGVVFFATVLPSDSSRNRSKHACMASAAVLVAGAGMYTTGKLALYIKFGLGLIWAGFAGAAFGTLGLILFRDKD